MKVLIPVLHYFPVIGGLETWTRKIAEGTAKKAEVFVITGKVKNRPKQEIYNNVNITRTSLFFLNNLSHSSLIYIITAMPFIFLKSLNLIKKEKIDIMHCQSFLSGFLGYFLFKLTKISYIITVQRLERDKSFIRRLVYNNAKTCIAASVKIREYFESIECKNIKVIPNGIDLERFRNLDRSENKRKLSLNGEFVIMTIARLEKVKGIKYLIQAVKDLDFKYKLLIIGDGSERENLENLSKSLGLKKHIQFLGQIENNRAPDYLSVADCFVLPSVSEGFGIVILEAMAAKVPVIATKVGGILDLIEDKETGILVDPKSPEQIKGAIVAIHSKLKFVKKLTEQAFSALKRYNWDNIIEMVYRIYGQYV